MQTEVPPTEVVGGMTAGIISLPELLLSHPQGRGGVFNHRWRPFETSVRQLGQPSLNHASSVARFQRTKAPSFIRAGIRPASAIRVTWRDEQSNKFTTAFTSSMAVGSLG